MSKRLDIIRKVRKLLGENGERHTKGTLARDKEGLGATYGYGSKPLEKLGGFCLVGACAYAVMQLDKSIEDPRYADGYYDLVFRDPDAQAVLWDIVVCVAWGERNATDGDPGLRWLERAEALTGMPQKSRLFDAVIEFNDRTHTTWEAINQVLECAEKRAREEAPVTLIPQPPEEE